MPERQGRAGETANNRLITLLDGLGWTQRGDSNVDVSCELPQHDERDTAHGVDGYMTYDDPYKTKERGVIIESKTKQWGNVNSSTLKSDAEQTLKTLECVPESDEFDEYLNFGGSRIVNSAVLGVWVNDGEYEHEEFNGYVNDIGIKNKRRKTYQILVLGNRDLNRLASLHSKFSDLKSEMGGDDESVSFYYPSLPDSAYPDRTQLISMEYMLSDYVFAKAQKRVDEGGVTRDKDITVVFYFDDINMDSLKFMFKSLIEYQMLDTEEVRVYLDDRSTEEDFQVESIVAGFEGEVTEERDENPPDFNFSSLPQVEYDSYTDELRGA